MKYVRKNHMHVNQMTSLDDDLLKWMIEKIDKKKKENDR